MKKLEDIPKNTFFKVPEGYFEKLPNTIQEKINAKRSFEPAGTFGFVRLAYILPVIVVLSIAAFWTYNNNREPQNVDTILASIPTEDLIAYLDESEISTEDILSDVDFSENDVEEIESEVFQHHFDDLEIPLNENDLKTDSL